MTVGRFTFGPDGPDKTSLSERLAKLKPDSVDIGSAAAPPERSNYTLDLTCTEAQSDYIKGVLRRINVKFNMREVEHG